MVACSRQGVVEVQDVGHTHCSPWQPLTAFQGLCIATTGEGPRLLVVERLGADVHEGTGIALRVFGTAPLSAAVSGGQVDVAGVFGQGPPRRRAARIISSRSSRSTMHKPRNIVRGWS